MVYLRVTGRAIINVHTANTEGAVGNYSGLSKMFIVRRTAEGYEVSEEPVISGNMVKHWHAVALTDRLLSQGYGKICETCKRHVMFRSNLPYDDEIKYIEECAIEDIHGFLNPNKQVRRESIAKFSFIVPVEDIRAEYEAVTHNRVVLTGKGTIPAEEAAMMVFKREHASGVYGFSCSMDLAYVGKAMADPTKTLSAEDRKVRAKAATLALADILSGRTGAAQSRALPIVKVVELLAVVSKKPIPNMVHGFYRDYAEESLGIIKAFLEKRIISKDEVKVYVVGEKLAELAKQLGEVAVIKKSAFEALADIAEVVEEWVA